MELSYNERSVTIQALQEYITARVSNRLDDGPLKKEHLQDYMDKRYGMSNASFKTVKMTSLLIRVQTAMDLLSKLNS